MEHGKNFVIFWGLRRALWSSYICIDLVTRTEQDVWSIEFSKMIEDLPSYVLFLQGDIDTPSKER